MACDLPFKIIGGLTDDVTVDEQYKTLNVDADGTYVARFNLSTFEIELAPNELIINSEDYIRDCFKQECNFVGQRGFVAGQKVLSCPASRTFEVNDKDYVFNLTYTFENEDLVLNGDTDHPTVYYFDELDLNEDNYIETKVTINYSLANNFISGSFDYYIDIFNVKSNLTVSMTGPNFTGIKDLFRDILNAEATWRLNEVQFNEETDVIFLINLYYAGFALKEGSKGVDTGSGVYTLPAGLYNISVNLIDGTVNFEESSGELTKEARRGFFNELKRREANVYIDPNSSENTIVLFDNISLKNIDKNFDFTDSNLNPISADVEILEKEGSYYSIDEWDSHYEISVKSSFNGFQIDSFDVGVSVNICVPGYFLKLEDVVFQCIFRHYPKSFTIEGNNYTSFEDNIITFENIHLNQGKNYVSIDHCDENGAPFRFVSGEGPLISFSNNTLNVPNEGIYTLTFNLNTMEISAQRIE